MMMGWEEVEVLESEGEGPAPESADQSETEEDGVVPEAESSPEGTAQIQIQSKNPAEEEV
jgi:hypothetical protein